MTVRRWIAVPFLLAWVALIGVSPSPAQVSYLADDFEHGLSKWLVSGSDWALIDSDFVSPGHSATESPDGNYLPNTNATLELAHPIDLSGATFPVLTFWEKFSIADYCDYDAALVEVSDDGGFTWSEIARRTCSTISTWQFVQIDLREHKTPLLKVRFRLRADGSSFVYDGWVLDDIAIRETDTTRIPFPFFDGFEGTLDDWIVSGSDWAQVGTDFVSPGQSITESPEGNYLANTNATLELAHPIDLSGSTFPVLTFWEKFSIADYCNYDAAVVEISDDGGFTWSVLGSPRTCSIISTWEFVQIDLREHRGPLVKIRFRLRADGSGFIYDGWSLDDVGIRETDATRIPFPFFDGFDDSLDDWTVSGSDWAQIGTDFVSPGQSITESPDGNYLANTNATLTLAHPIDLSGATFPVLTFWEKFSIADYCNYDVAVVEISDDGGFTWSELGRRTCSTISTWRFVQIDLRQHNAPLVAIRFRLRADGSGFIYDGWSLDDVEIFDLQGARCGDGVTQPPETCDDGNTVVGDGCSRKCRLEATGQECVDAGGSCTAAGVCGRGQGHLGLQGCPGSSVCCFPEGQCGRPEDFECCGPAAVPSRPHCQQGQLACSAAQTEVPIGSCLPMPTPSATVTYTPTPSVIPTPTSTATVTKTPTDGATGTPTTPPTVPPSRTATATVTSTSTPPNACAGDCNMDRLVTIGELVQGVNISLGARAVDSCPPMDADGDGQVGISDLIRAVRAVLDGCTSALVNGGVSHRFQSLSSADNAVARGDHAAPGHEAKKQARNVTDIGRIAGFAGGRCLREIASVAT